MSADQTSSMIISIVMLIVSIGFIIQGQKLRKTQIETIAVSKKSLQTRGTILLVCGTFMFLGKSYEIIKNFL